MNGYPAYTEHKGHAQRLEKLVMRRLVWTIRPSVVQLWHLRCSAAAPKVPGSVMALDRWRGLDVLPSLKGMEPHLIWVKGEGVAPQ